MSDNQKQSDFISRVRQAATAYRDTVADMDALANEWSALYNTIVT